MSEEKGALTFDGIYYRVGEQRVEPGVTIRRYDQVAGAWFEGTVVQISSYDHEKQERIYSLALIVEGYAPSPLIAGDDIEIISKAELHNREMVEQNRILLRNREKPWLPFDENE